jgi:hypothetical protein
MSLYCTCVLHLFQTSEFEELKEKLKKYKSNSTLMRLFKAHTAGDDPLVKSAKPTKVFRKPSLNGGESTPISGPTTSTPQPVKDNDTILESEQYNYKVVKSTRL